MKFKPKDFYGDGINEGLSEEWQCKTAARLANEKLENNILVNKIEYEQLQRHLELSSIRLKELLDIIVDQADERVENLRKQLETDEMA